MPADAVYIANNQRVGKETAGAEPFLVLWTERQEWEEGQLWWSSLVRSKADGTPVVKMELRRVEEVRGVPTAATRPAGTSRPDAPPP